jgi:hypothetical protein
LRIVVDVYSNLPNYICETVVKPTFDTGQDGLNRLFLPRGRELAGEGSRGARKHSSAAMRRAGATLGAAAEPQSLFRILMSGGQARQARQNRHKPTGRAKHGDETPWPEWPFNPA